MVRINSDQLTRLIKNGLRLQLSSYDYPLSEELEAYEDNSDFSPRPPAPPAPSTDSSFSETNVHVAGVDEADVVKYDGKHWFIAYPDRGDENPAGIQIVATAPEVSDAEIVGRFDFEGSQWGDSAALFLTESDGQSSEIVSLREQPGNLDPIMPTALPVCITTPWFEPANGKIKVEFIDVSNPGSPSEAGELTMDGRLIDSRRIDNTLYLVSRFDPWVTNLGFEHNEGSREQNEELLQQATLEEIVPNYTKGGVSRPLSDTCLAQSDVEETSGFHSLVNLTAIDLESKTVVSSECVATGVKSMVMSPESLYLTGTVWADDYNRTVIHKFDLEAMGVVYAATGSVRGSVNNDAHFRIHEHEGLLRVLSTEWTPDWRRLHRLSILSQFDQALETIASLPSETRSEPIGKPDEDVYAVRFTENRAYVVTFRQVDPLYVLDLTDPLDPFIAGSLEVPGYATYIHPLNDRFLFTLGYEVDPENGMDLGIKAQLVNIDDGVPTLSGQLVIGDAGTYSEALDDLRALNVLKMDESTTRISFPVHVNSSSQFSDNYTGLQMIELTGLNSATGQLRSEGVLLGGNLQSASFLTGERRGLLHGDAVFYTIDEVIWATLWGSDEPPRGPIGGGPVGCTDHIEFGLEVYVSGQFMQPIDNCGAQVVAVDDDYTETLRAEYRESLDACVFYGAPERAGRYTITVSLDGYETQVSEDVVVSQDVCHVQPRSLMFQLSPSADL